MKHVFQWLSGTPCTDAQEADVAATVCASDIARVTFPHLRVAMLMPLVLVPPPQVPSLAKHGTSGQETHDKSGTSEDGSFQMCDPSDVFPEPTTFAVVDLSAYTLQSCAEQGLVLTGKWVFAATGRGEWIVDTITSAAAYGQLEFAKWARSQGCDFGNVVMNAAASHGHLEFAQWARAEGCKWGAYVLHGAAKGGHLAFAQWARAEGCEWGTLVIYAAACGGHVEFGKWAKAEGCKWDYGVVRAAARGGHLEFGKWAKAEGCEWGSGVMSEAARGGCLEFAQWAHAEGCDFGNGVVYAAAKGGHLEFAKWALSHKPPLVCVFGSKAVWIDML